MSAQGAVREKQVNIRFTDEEVEWLERLASHFSLTPGFLVRMLIKQKHDELFPDLAKGSKGLGRANKRPSQAHSRPANKKGA
jgi:hypothetical protein